MGMFLPDSTLKPQEVLDSVKIIQQLIGELESGEISVLCQIKDGYALSLVEAPRGQNFTGSKSKMA